MINISSNTVFFLLLFQCLFFVADYCHSQEKPRQYIAYKTKESITIDGKAKESSWQKTKWSDEYIDIEGVKKPKYKTQMKMLWDSQYFYVYAKMEEPHIWGNLYQRDTVIFYNNDFEIFIDPDGDTHNYMELEFNALNTIWDLFLTKPYLNHGLVLDHWSVRGLSSAVFVKGTINNPDDIDTFWAIEIAMPWDALVEATSDKKLPKNKFWRINFSRVNWDFQLEDGKYSRKKGSDGKYLREYNWVWSPQHVINMHKPEKWGYVFFSDKNVGANSNFKIPKDEYIKWYMYDFFRILNAKNNNTIKNDVLTSEKIVLNKKIKINKKQEDNSWHLWVKSPFTNKKLIIDENGKYYEQEN